MDRSAQSGPCRLIWRLVAALAALQVCTFSAPGLTRPWQDIVPILLGTAAVLAGSAFYAHVRPDERSQGSCERSPNCA